jgi:hypothetical protein
MGHELIQAGEIPPTSLFGSGEFDKRMSKTSANVAQVTLPGGPPGGERRIALVGAEHGPAVGAQAPIRATTSDVQTEAILARTRRGWSNWKLRTQREISEKARRGVQDLHLVPTVVEMHRILRELYGSPRL